MIKNERWIDHNEMRARGIEIHDAKGHKICFVRGFMLRNGAVELKCLIPVWHEGKPAPGVITGIKGEEQPLEVAFTLPDATVVWNDGN